MTHRHAIHARHSLTGRHHRRVIMLGMFVSARSATADGPVLLTLYPAHFLPHRLEGAAPGIGPGQAGEQQHQRQPRYPEAGDRVHIAPRRFRSQRQPRIEQTRRPAPGCVAPFGPPQVEPGKDHHDCPACRQLHQPAPRLADQQLAVDFMRDLHDPPIGIERAQHLALRRDEDIAHRLFPAFVATARQADMDQCGIAFLLWQAIGVEPRAGIGRQHCLHLITGADFPGDRQVLIGAFFPAFDLRLEQIDRPGQRQNEHHRHHKHPGIEMPAPDGAIETD